MGQSIFRVTAKTIKLVDGRIAHVTKYAYKPYSDSFCSDRGAKRNAQLHFRTGCVASEKLALKSDLIVTLHVDGTTGGLYRNARGLKVFNDDACFGADVMPRLGTVRRVGTSYQLEA